MDNNKRKEFVKGLTEGVTLSEAQIQEFYQKNQDGNMNPEIGQMIDGYKNYIADLGGGFLDIAEVYNQCLKIAKSNELVGNIKLKARIKDFSSSYTNTDKKMLDDVFGMEVVTSTEFEKEIMMLFNHLLFDIQNDKKYNKETGYVAYHCTADLNPKENDDLKEKIQEILEQTKTKEYKKSRHSDSKTKNTSNRVNVFKILPNVISDPDKFNEIANVLEKMLECAKTNEIPPENIPIIEFHFLTSEAEFEATRGRASHANYKSINTRLIKEYYNNGRLMRGINAPIKFVSSNNGLVLQDFDDTLIENWPCLKEDIVKKRNLEDSNENIKKVRSTDKLTAYQFPFLRKYIDGNNEYKEELREEKWGMLKAIIILNRIDMSQKSLKDAEEEAQNSLLSFND